MIRLSGTATRSEFQRVCAISDAMIEEKALAALRNTRHREIHVFHENDQDPVQRMLNALQPSSYVRPHRHAAGKSETIILLKGSLGFVSFSDEGIMDNTCSVLLQRGGGALGVDCRGGVWHTYFALEAGTVVFETKAGPFDATMDKESAPWAPGENTLESLQYLANMEDGFRQHAGLGKREWSTR